MPLYSTRPLQLEHNNRPMGDNSQRIAKQQLAKSRQWRQHTGREYMYCMQKYSRSMSEIQQVYVRNTYPSRKWYAKHGDGACNHWCPESERTVVMASTWSTTVYKCWHTGCNGMSSRLRCTSMKTRQPTRAWSKVKQQVSNTTGQAPGEEIMNNCESQVFCKSQSLEAH